MITLSDDSGLEINCLNGAWYFFIKMGREYGGFDNAMSEILKN